MGCNKCNNNSETFYKSPNCETKTTVCQCSKEIYCDCILYKEAYPSIGIIAGDTLCEATTKINSKLQNIFLQLLNAGKSAYQIAVENGFVGDEADWLLSLEGTDGTPGADGINGTDGDAGKSAYDIAVENGFFGTEQQWLQSLNSTKTVEISSLPVNMTALVDTYVFDGSIPQSFIITDPSTFPSNRQYHMWFVKNRGSDSLTLDASAIPEQLYTTSAVNTLILAAGESCVVQWDGDFFNVMFRV